MEEKKYANSVLIDEDVMKSLEECIKLAPLHNPPNIIGINACKALIPNTQWLQYLIQLSIKLYQNMLIYIHYHMNYIKKYGVRKIWIPWNIT